MGWKTDIAFWASKNSRETSEVEKIAINKGWEPAKYQDSMRDSLLDFLDKWYTLSVKTLPEPATKTSNRRNPIEIAGWAHKYTKLSNGWRIWTIQEGDGYSVIASDSNRYIEYSNNSLNDSVILHKEVVNQLRNNNG